jgi:hypothetical protein
MNPMSSYLTLALSQTVLSSPYPTEIIVYGMYEYMYFISEQIMQKLEEIYY